MTAQTKSPKCAPQRRWLRVAACASALVLSSVNAEAQSVRDTSALLELGRALFFDGKLSTPAGTSCASCHDPQRAFTSNNGSRFGVPRGSRPNHFARRSAPSLLYLKYVPRFRFFQEGDDPGLSPMGGFFWDGRADSISELVRQPLMNPDEMNNATGLEVASKIRASEYASVFERAFGERPSSGEATLTAVGRALEAFLTTDEMAPFSSKFDQFLRGRALLSSAEAEGLRAFKDPGKGNCASCHVLDDSSHDPTLSLFTDYGYDAVAPPRNTHLPAGRADLGLCERSDRITPSDENAYCANFRTPSLRNVALRASFMHNGAFTDLRSVVAFYATRDSDPKRWYPSGVKFDDVPKAYRGHVNTSSPPYDLRAGEARVLDERDVDDIVAFLKTLTDARYASLERAR